jgi:Fur family ferric uptake transcriptional regulator
MAETDQVVLERAGLRFTPQRQAVAAALQAMGKEVSVQELFERVRRRHPYIGRATVFRSVDHLVQAGLARRLERPGHVSAYVWCEATHHHHLICTECRAVQELDDRLVKPLVDSINREQGFQVDHATLDFYGRCRRHTGRSR